MEDYIDDVDDQVEDVEFEIIYPLYTEHLDAMKKWRKVEARTLKLSNRKDIFEYGRNRKKTSAGH